MGGIKKNLNSQGAEKFRGISFSTFIPCYSLSCVKKVQIIHRLETFKNMKSEAQ